MPGNARRFGVFTFGVDTLELCRNGRPIPVQPQPARVLATLLAHAGHAVTREPDAHSRNKLEISGVNAERPPRRVP